MNEIFEIVFYIFSFLSIYIQIYFLVVFLENRDKLKNRKNSLELFKSLAYYPEVTITVPAYNEGENIVKTVESLLNVNYPQDKLHIILVDDGSSDNTWDIMQSYQNHPQIKIFTKENGGKYSAQNLGLEHCTTKFIGCLDADSTVHPEALNRIMSYFLENENIMAVCPTIVSSEEKNLLQKAQKVEYELQIYIKKMLGFINAINVTPGPFSIFRKSVFEKIGPYRHAHTTEDQEIALRMQANSMRIENAADAYVYTNTPKTVRALHKQRTRWMYGFIQNTRDYRKLFFSKKYGNVGFISLPSGYVTMFSVILLFFFSLYTVFVFLRQKYLVISATGFDFSFGKISFNPFFINTSVISFITILTFAFLIFTLFMGHRMLKTKIKFSLNMFWFYTIYAFISPFWIMKAIINSVRHYEPNWKQEIDTR